MNTTVNSNGKSIVIELTPQQIAAVRKGSIVFTDIKSFQDALNFKGETLEEFNKRTEHDTSGEKAEKVLAAIAYAVRGGKTLGKEDVWYRPWFERVSGGVGLRFVDYDFSLVSARLASRLCVCDSDQAVYFGTEFVKEWADYVYATE